MVGRDQFGEVLFDRIPICSSNLNDLGNSEIAVPFHQIDDLKTKRRELRRKQPFPLQLDLQACLLLLQRA